MQTRKSIVNLPLITGIVLSITLHVAALYSYGFHTPPRPQLATGRTVVQLTLLPSTASKATITKPEEQLQPEPEQTQPEQKKQVEQLPEPEKTPEPVVEQIPEEMTEVVPEPKPEQLPENNISSVNSAEQDSTLIVEKGVIVDAQPTVGIQPFYPRISRRRGEEGVVTLSVQIFDNGKKGDIKIVESSGYHRLDEAAQKAVQKASFFPAQTMGSTIESTIELSFVFELTDE